MRNFKDIIIEKLKVSTNNNGKLPYLEDFEEAVYNFNNAHEIAFEDIDPKYRDLENCPQYKKDGTVYNVISLYESKHRDGRKYLYAFCSMNTYTSTQPQFMISSMNQLVELLGEELVLQIWNYIK